MFAPATMIKHVWADTSFYISFIVKRIVKYMSNVKKGEKWKLSREH